MELNNEDKKYGWFPYWRCWMKEDSIFSLDADLNNLWVWCLSKASHTNTKWDFIVKGKGKIYVELLPGQFVCGRHSMAKSLGTSSNPSTTWKRLKMLESHGFISIKSDKKYSIVTILNWDSYKNTKCLTEQERELERELDREQETRQQRDTKKNVNNGNKLKEDIYVRFFEEFWKFYPARNGKKLEKQETFKKFKLLKESELEQIILAARNYADDDDVKKGIGIRDPKRFFKNEFWKEFINKTKPKRYDEIGF